MNRHNIETLFVVGVPLSLAVLELFHPMADDLLQLPVRRWLIVHYAQVLLFPAAAVAAAQLFAGQRGADAWVARIALFVFAVIYVSFDTAAGIVTGELVRAANASPDPSAWLPAIEAIWRHPVIGGTGPFPLLAASGSIALGVAGVTGAIAMRRSGAGWAPCLLFAAFPLGISIFRTHAWPGGPLTFGLLAAAAAWRQFEKFRQAT